MKQKTLFLLCLCLLTGIKALAYDVEINGIYYILRGSTDTAEVTSGDSPYSGAIVIPESIPLYGRSMPVTSISSDAFRGCTGLTSVTIGNRVTSIGNYAFSGCSGLTSLTIGSSVTSIGDYAFYQCSNLTSINIPNSVTSIGQDAFYGCTSLTSITIGNSVTSIGYNAFNGCYHLISVTIPNSVISIGSSAFSACRSLTSVTIGNSVTSIGSDAFSFCRSLTSVTIPNSVTSIGDNAFNSCTGLTTVTIGNSVTSIGYRVFEGCSGLTNVWCYAESVPNTLSYAFNNSSISSATLHVPAGSVESYRTTTPWSGFGSIVPIEENASVNIGSTGYATYCSTHALDFSEVNGVKVYIASGFSPSTGKLVLTRVDEVPAGEGLYLVGEEGTHTIPYTETDMMYSNLLKGVTTATAISPTEGDYTNFILANGSHGVGFYTLSTSGELAAGKAYLQLPTASVTGVKALKVILDDEGDDDATGIKTLSDSPLKGENIFNLAGQRLNKAQKGINIINGKKVFIK